MSDTGRKFLFFVVNALIHAFHFLLKKTCTFKADGKLVALLESSEPAIFAVFHQDVTTTYPFLLKYGRKNRLCSIASLSKDGELAAYLMEHLGIRAVRGSSSREGLKGFLELMRLIKEERYSVIFICDGPRRPFGRVQPGVLMLASVTGIPIYILRSRAGHQLILEKSPPQLFIPRPFSEIAVLSIGPIEVEKGRTKEVLEQYREKIQNGFDKLILDADSYFNA